MLRDFTFELRHRLKKPFYSALNFYRVIFSTLFHEFIQESQHENLLASHALGRHFGKILTVSNVGAGLAYRFLYIALEGSYGNGQQKKWILF